ncbi:hypothetical protein FGIG_02104 [Fasciola gigantica]|uniref:Uncharacterized protein n=1 Tax=Fasciola gigantica TaxID=46835 RepID=A0A504YTR3_FASGI|nr:hypothetical protein FGIG_02104 [Fasciola gigantica]
MVQPHSSEKLPSTHSILGSQHDPDNNRPINLSPASSETMEPIVKSQITDYFLPNCLQNPVRRGFVKWRSCSSCQNDNLNTLPSAVDDEIPATILFLDPSKAIDGISYQHPSNKSKSPSLAEQLLSCFPSDLSARSRLINMT